MRRVSRETLRTRLLVGLTVMAPYRKKAFGLHEENLRLEVVEDMLQRIMGSPESEAVILEPDMAGDPHSPRRGCWGVDEPHPHPDLPFGQH